MKEKAYYLQGAYNQQLDAEKAKQLVPVGLEVISFQNECFLYLREHGCKVIESCVGLQIEKSGI